MMKDEGNRVGEDTLDTISQGETSYKGSRHQDTVGTERVSPDRSAYESDTIGTEENWEEDYRDQKKTRDRRPAVYVGKPQEDVNSEGSETNSHWQCLSKWSVCPTDHREEGIHRERSPAIDRLYRGVTFHRSRLKEQGTQTREILLRGRKKTQEDWDEQSVCWIPEIQNQEEI